MTNEQAKFEKIDTSIWRPFNYQRVRNNFQRTWCKSCLCFRYEFSKSSGQGLTKNLVFVKFVIKIIPIQIKIWQTRSVIVDTLVTADSGFLPTLLSSSISWRVNDNAIQWQSVFRFCFLYKCEDANVTGETCRHLYQTF